MGWEPPGCAERRAVPGNHMGAPWPSSCRRLGPQPNGLAFSAVAFLLPPQSLRPTSLHFLCQTLVSGWGGLPGLWRGGGVVQLWW